MRIAMIGQKGVPATYGGIERHVEELATRLVAAGHEVIAYCRPHYTPADASLPGVRLVRLPSLNTKHLDAISHVALCSAHALFSDADVVHYHALGPSSLAWLPRLGGKRTVVTVHGLDWRRAKWGRVASTYLHVCSWTATRLPHATIVVSRTLRDYFQRHDGRETFFVPNGTPLPPLGGDGYVRSLGLEPGRYLLFVGRLVPEKGVELLVEAHRTQVPDWPLVVAGEGHFTDDYVERCQKAAGPGVQFPGSVYGEDLASLWQHATLVVVPSALEGLSIALLEAMSYGRPVLGSDIPENLEVIEGVGESFRSGDASHLGQRLRELLSAPDHLADMGRRSRERIERDYSWDGVVRRTLGVYESVLRGDRPRRDGG